MRKLVYFFFLLAIFTSCENESYKNLEEGIYADMETDRGTILFKLYPDEVPLTVSNFITLAEGTNPEVVDSLSGKKYFNELGFHRVVKDFIVQGGDPQGDGFGGPGYKFRSEFHPSLRHTSEGILSMANSGGVNTNGSQFFITLKPTPWLDGYTNTNQLKDCSRQGVNCHTVFGKVITGQAAVDSISQYDMIKSVKIIRIGDKAKSFDAVKVFTDEFAKGPEMEKARLATLEKQQKENLAKAIEADKGRYEQFLKDKEVFYKKMGVAKATKKKSGLQILTYKKGKGKKFSPSILSSIEYTIYLADGKKIQTSEGAKPLTFVLDETPLITGVKEAISEMRVGGKVRLFIPYYIGYGEAAYGPFPRKADLVFDLELIKVGK